MAPAPTAPSASPGPECYRFGGLRLDAAAHLLSRDGQAVALEPKAFAVLLELLRHPGQLVGRDQLLDAVWGHRHVTPGVLTRSIAQLRTALQDDSHHPIYIQTQHALGYRFIGALEPEMAADAVSEAESTGPSPEVPALPAAAADLEPAAPSEPALSFPGYERRQSVAAWSGRSSLLLAVLVVALAWLAFGSTFRRPPVEASIAVLPFSTLSDDAKDRYFSEGLSAEMLSALAGVHGLRVAAWLPESAIDRSEGTQALGRRLGVATLLDASVRREGDRVRIVARLSDAADGSIIWSGSYERDATNVFETQGEIAREVAQALLGTLPDGGEGLRRRLTPTRDVAAFDAYLRGMDKLRGASGGREEAAAYFNQALSKDAGFARAQAGLCQIELWRFEGHHNADAFESARLACLRAANMDPGIGDVQLALGTLYRVMGNPAKAHRHFSSAGADLSVRPMALVGRATVYAEQGKLAESIALLNEALALAPNDPDVLSHVGYQQYLANRLPESIATLRKLSQLRPDNAYDWGLLGSVLMSAGRDAEALVALERSAAIEPLESVTSNLGAFKYRAGDYAGAVENLRKAVALNPGNFDLWGNLGDALMADPGTAAQARGAFREAANRAQDFVDIKDDDAEALALLGWYRANLGELAAARDLAQRSEALDSSVAEVWLQNAETWAALGDLEKARELLAKARAAGSPDARINSSLILLRSGLVAARAPPESS